MVAARCAAISNLVAGGGMKPEGKKSSRVAVAGLNKKSEPSRGALEQVNLRGRKDERGIELGKLLPVAGQRRQPTTSSITSWWGRTDDHLIDERYRSRTG